MKEKRQANLDEVMNFLNKSINKLRDTLSLTDTTRQAQDILDIILVLEQSEEELGQMN